VAFIGGGDRLLDLLRGVELVIAERDRVVLAGKQHEDVDIVVLGLRPVDQPARAGPLAQRVVDIFRIVGEHAEGAVAAHHGRAPAKLSISTAVTSCWPADARSSERFAATWSMSSIVPKPIAFGLTIVDEFLAVLPRLALVGRDLVDAEILVVERVAGDRAVVVDQPGDHLDQDGLAGAGRAVADEGEEKPPSSTNGLSCFRNHRRPASWRASSPGTWRCGCR
jgi:hypothetical protein